MMFDSGMFLLSFDTDYIAPLIENTGLNAEYPPGPPGGQHYTAELTLVTLFTRSHNMHSQDGFVLQVQRDSERV